MSSHILKRVLVFYQFLKHYDLHFQCDKTVQKKYCKNNTNAI